jgi:soluble lytic murein transglycosylase-like protein
LVRAVIQAESRGNPRAVSNKGAGGLMQLMPATAKALGVSPQDRFNPQKNVEAGSRYLQQMITKFGDVKLALAAYNHGPGNIRKKMAAVTEGGKGVTYEDIKTYLPAETRAYVAKIIKNIG